MLVEGFFNDLFKLVVEVTNKSLKVFPVLKIKKLNVHENFTELSLIICSLHRHLIHVVLKLKLGDD